MQQNMENGLEISFSDDYTKAYIYIQQKDRKYTEEEIRNSLADAGVKNGINADVVKQIAEGRTAGAKMLAATSKLPVDGKDGWFEFLFETEVSNKPKILKDGSVDYSAYGNVPSVEEGERIAIYHPAVDGEDGENLLGETILAKKGKELARLKGKGFTVSEDGLIYCAKFDGRATYQNEKLSVENELVVDGDVSVITGDIHYANDVRIRGNVLAGMSVTSTKGSIIVDGYVEAAQLQAKKEIVLKSGMQGNFRGKLIAGGSISGKFFEQATLESGEDISANAIMNCTVKAVRDVTVNGRFGIIVGGSIQAERRISATIIGNMSEVKTVVTAGIESDLFAKLSSVEKRRKTIEEELGKIVNALNQIQILIEKSQMEDLKARKMDLLRAKIDREAQLAENEKMKTHIVEQMGRANKAEVSVQKVLYPGTLLSINGVKIKIAEETCHVRYCTKGSGVEVLEDS